MYRSIDDFAENWNFETEATANVLANLTDASLATCARAGERTLGFVAWHIVTTIPEMLPQAGIACAGPASNAPVPTSAKAIADAYAKAAVLVVPAVRKAWTDAQLTDMIPMYGEQWPKRAVLNALINHQTHHRGQMTTLMRQAGLKVPGIYGPAREEWAQYGLPQHP